MNWGENKTHETYGPDDYDRSYGKGQPIYTVVFLNKSGHNLRVFKERIPQDTPIYEIIKEIDTKYSDSTQQILNGDRLNTGYKLKDANGNNLLVSIDDPIESIVSHGKSACRQAIFYIVYGSDSWCSVMGGKKSRKAKKSKKSRKTKKSKKSRKHRK